MILNFHLYIIMKIQTQLELLNIIGGLVLFENDLYKIVLISAIFFK